MNVIRHKIWYDLWKNKGRTLQVVLIIAMGAFAIGMIIGSRMLMSEAMNKMWQASSPAMINLAVNPAADDEVIAALENMQGVANVEGLLETSIEWRLSPDDEWSVGNLTAREDYEDQKYTTLELVSGAWPEKDVLAVEQGADTYFNLQPGNRIYLRVKDREREFVIGNVVYNPIAQPPGFGGNAQFYTTREQFDYLTGERDFNTILAGAPRWDEEEVTDLADRMQRQLEKLGIDSSGTFLGRVSNPNKHFFQDVLDGIFLVMGVMATLALILGLFLVYNTISAIVTQQVNQIGIMKAVGAKNWQILLIYLANVLIYGLLALLIALPLGALGAYGLNQFLLNTFNVQPGPFTLSPAAVVAQVVIALLAPLLASLVPIFAGSRITVREAISTYGLSTGGSGWLDRLLAKAQRIPRLVLLTLSNTFRHKGRVILTQITLVGSGLIFMMIMSVRDSAAYTFSDMLFSVLRFNVSLQFEDPERMGYVEELTRTYPGVKAVEMWGLEGASIRLAGLPESEEDESALLFGVPLPTTLYGAQLRAGRWLQPDDRYAVVLNQKLAEDAGVTLGDRVTFDHGVKGESTWTVVGLLFDPIITNSAHVPRDVLLREVRSVGKASTVWIQTGPDDPDGEAEMAEKLRAYYDQQQLEVTPQSIFGRDTATQITEQIMNNFGVIITLLATMAIVIGLVGSIALSGVLSLNVLERTREIGVMRAIGASSISIAGLFIGEGLILGLLSWVIALPLSLPAGQAMTQALGAAVGGEIVYKYTPTGAIYWLAIIVILSVAASWFPARSATRISVRESLAYS